MQTTNFLEDNLEENLDDLGYGANFLDKGQRQYPWGGKKKTNKLDFNKIKAFALWKIESVESEVVQWGPTLCDPMDCSLPGSSVHGIFQARVLEWVAISFSRGSSQPRDQTWSPTLQRDTLLSVEWDANLPIWRKYLQKTQLIKIITIIKIIK